MTAPTTPRSSVTEVSSRASHLSHASRASRQSARASAQPSVTFSDLRQSERSEGDELTLPTFPQDILQLKHSFGYDCKRLFNLVLIDERTLIFASGNYLHYFDIPTRTVTFRETIFGHGIGFITKNEHPDYTGLFTVAENGPRPTIFIYEYPSHNVRIQLEGAAKWQFTCGSYNSTGELFASQAGHPDFMLTIWRWEKAEIILRSKSFQNNVLFVHFSLFNPILLCSCGLSHIKFWKMANTFTGLKLKGDLGRFGKTDFSDIYAVFMLADENVISGCDWGNMLLWEAGLIKFEVCRKGRKPCHTKPIVRITMDNGEVMTVGMDGYVRIWFWETVDLADPPDEDRFVEIEPIYEFYVGECEIRGLQKIKPFDSKDFGHYAQDGKGGIWFCDLNIYDIPAESRKLYRCHGGKVIAAQTSPVSTHLMTLGEDGKIFIFDFNEQSILLEKSFASLGTDLLWFNTAASSNGMEFVVSFADGLIRHYLLEARVKKLHLVKVIKAHVAPITKVRINPKNAVLVSASEDMTIFAYRITGKVNSLIDIQPIGFVKLDGIPVSINWNNMEFCTALIGCRGGEVYLVKIPHTVTEKDTFLTYNLTKNATIQATKFVSVKSRIRRDIKREETKIRKEQKRQRKIEEVERLKAANPGLQIDMETALADSEPEEEEEALHIPAVPNPILWLRITQRQTIWTSMAGYDAGYIYELSFGAAEPVICTMIADCDDIEIHSYFTIKDYLIFGLINGCIRVNRLSQKDFTDLRDYRLVSMHDGIKGIITRIVASFDGRNVFTVGHDGNIFAYHWHGPRVRTLSSRATIITPPANIGTLLHVTDIDDPEFPSLEQEKIYAELKRKEAAAAAHDRKVLDKIGELQEKFNEIWKINESLPDELRVSHRHLLLDSRITNQISDELQAELDDVREDLAYDLEVAQVGKQKLYNYFLKELSELPIKISGIRKDLEVHSFRSERLGEEFDKMKREIEERLQLEAAKRRHVKPALAEVKEDSIPEPPVEDFFFGRDPESIIPRFSRKMLRLLRSYRARQQHEVERVYDWSVLERQKPDPDKNHPDDDDCITDAERNLGDYKLKIGYDYEPKPTDNLTYKYIELVECREKIFRIINAFHKKLYLLRKQKHALYTFMEGQRKRMEKIHRLLPKKNRQYLPVIPESCYVDENPEKHLVESCFPGCGIEISDILYLEKNVHDLLPPPPPPVVKPHISEEDIAERDQYSQLNMQAIDYMPDIERLMDDINAMPKVNDPAYYEFDANGVSPWLVETRYHWLLDILDEQQGIIIEVEDGIKKFDEGLLSLSHSRLHAKFDTEFMKAHMITLHQELNILRDSEEIENQLLHNADEAMKERNQLLTIINASNRQIDESRRACDRLTEQISSLQVKFLSTTKGHKFFDFLRRIFKKRYRAPKPPKNEDESSESSSSEESSTEDDEETKSIDSTDMTTIRLDETHCPTGLERPMYELAFRLRAERHELEKNLVAQHKLIEQRKLEVAEMHKQMKYQEDIYAQEQETLKVFRRKRQQELNKVKTSIVISMAQIQHFYETQDYRVLDRAVLFDSQRLNALKGRVSQLNEEMFATRRLYRINIVHLRRLNTDIKFMRYEILRLEEQTREEMRKKFGVVINLDELEEEVLRKYVFDLETTAEAELRAIEAEMRKRRRELATLVEELIHETNINSEKLNIHSVLQEEKNFLDEVLGLQEKSYDRWMVPAKMDYDRDILKLKEIDHHQKAQIEFLEREIVTLRMKSKPLEIVHHLEKKVEEVPLTVEVLPNDDIFAPLAMPETKTMRYSSEPDDFLMDRVIRAVQKCFVQHFTKHMSVDNIRKYAHRVGGMMGRAGYCFEGNVTDRIMETLTENIQEMLPKKYMIHLSAVTLRQLFEEILNVFDYERSEVNTEDVIGGIYSNVMDALAEAPETLNRTQFIVLEMFKQLIEVLPLEEFQSEKTWRTMVDILDKEANVHPKCINIELLVEQTSNHARENLLDGITSVPIRRLGDRIHKELLRRKGDSMRVKCSMSSVGKVEVSTK